MGAMLAAPAATIVDNRTGHATSIDAKAYDALRAFLRALGVAYANEEEGDVRLTTGQAAQIVGTSPRTIARLIDSEKIRGTRVGNGHRYVMLSDLMEFDRRSKAERGTHLKEMRRIADAEDFYGHNEAMAEYLRSLE
ncbi:MULTISPECIES: helix-turn-helix domain-containing protein [unclassified Adlercreutzia]|uniref:helix-turn-helix domain-containing protein n=1 Tax=unclassified Adlercreutzia TaxID=2636013 RepID=UPI0013E9A5E6|nr:MULTISPECIES: helix-turn-helix domain-containing protein [unclassified Adlercreutzia]